MYLSEEACWSTSRSCFNLFPSVVISITASMFEELVRGREQRKHVEDGVVESGVGEFSHGNGLWTGILGV